MSDYAYKLGRWLAKEAGDNTKSPPPKITPSPPPVTPAPAPAPAPAQGAAAGSADIQKFRKYLTPLTDKNRSVYGGWGEGRKGHPTPYPELFRSTGTVLAPTFTSKLKPLPAVPFSTLESVASRMSPSLFDRVYSKEPNSLRHSVARQVLPILGKPNLDVSEAESPLGQAVKAKLTRQPPRAPFSFLDLPFGGFFDYRTNELAFAPAAGTIRPGRDVTAESVLGAALRGGGILSHESEHSQREMLPPEFSDVNFTAESDIISNKKFEDLRTLARGGKPRARTAREEKAVELIRRLRGVSPAEELGAVTAEWSLLADAVKRSGGDPYSVKIQLDPKRPPISLGRVLEESIRHGNKRMSELWDNPAGQQYLMNLNKSVLENKQETADVF